MREPLDLEAFEKIVACVEFPNREFHVRYVSGRFYLQLEYDAADAQTGTMRRNYTRKWLLSPWMTRSEIVQTCFKAVLTSVEHETREFFKYNGRSVYDPHYDVDVLWSLRGEAKALDVRPEDPAP